MYISGTSLSIGIWVLYSKKYLHHRNSKLVFTSAKFDNFKDEKIVTAWTSLILYSITYAQAFIFMKHILILSLGSVPKFEKSGERSLDGVPGVAITFPDGYKDTLYLSQYYSNEENRCTINIYRKPNNHSINYRI